MYKFDRMEWPKRYKLKGSVVILVILGIFIGVLIHQQNNKRLQESIVISDISFDDWGSQYIELGYTIENKSSKPQQITLLAKVWDAEGEELASALFGVDIPAQIRQNRSKLLDKLFRSLKENERPYRAQITLYQRRLL